MSCIKVPLSGGPAAIFPIAFSAMEGIFRTGGEAMARALGTDPQGLKPPAERFVGASRRPDGAPFYMSMIAPASFDAVRDGAWSGAFYVPLGYGHVIGTVEGEADKDTVTYFSVDAKLLIGRKETVAADWRVLGPAAKVETINLTALIDHVRISKKGPHDPDDMRRCIALHAPAAAWGDPRGLVAQQCGVALACLTEAIC